jgi:hypothetical protein
MELSDGGSSILKCKVGKDTICAMEHKLEKFSLVEVDISKCHYLKPFLFFDGGLKVVKSGL